MVARPSRPRMAPGVTAGAPASRVAGGAAVRLRWLSTLAALALAAACRWERPVDDSTRHALQTAAAGLSPAALESALAARACAVASGAVRPRRRQPHLAVIDYSAPSTQPRLWVFDLDLGAVVFHEWVAHGSGAGGEGPPVFSDVPDSHCSSLGAFATAELYTGTHGLSLRLDGLQPGVNGRARARDIVVHGAAYVSRDHITEWGRLGRSWGCPAVRVEVAEPLVRALADRALLYAWHDELPAAPLAACR